jgi:hypothetical protein
MSRNTLLHVHTNSKAKRSPYLGLCVHIFPCRPAVAALNKEASHAL